MILEVFSIIFIFALFFIFYFLSKLSEKISNQAQINLEQAKKIEEIREKLSLGNQFQTHLKNGIEKTRELLEELKRRDEVRKEKEKEFLERIKRVDEIIAGTTAKGISGEEILRETFKKLPPEMIETNFQVRGKIVEFALVLPNGKRLPVDSKWPASKLILSLEKETLPEKRKEIIEEIEKEVMKRIREVEQYIDPDLTWSQAIAAIPDSVYSICQKAHLKAREKNVILMPYSMVLPLLLYMYRLHLQYAISIDIENLQNHLISISKNLDEMEQILENKISRGTSMISNAYLEYKNRISQIRSSLKELQLKGEKENKKIQSPNQ
jgi:DNA recombination protein RmuC